MKVRDGICLATIDDIIDRACSSAEACYYWSVRERICATESLHRQVFVRMNRVASAADLEYRKKIALVRKQKTARLDSLLRRLQIDMTAYQIALAKLDDEYPPVPLEKWKSVVGL